MIPDDKSAHDRKVDELAARYAREGYAVVKEPTRSDLPFELGQYEPDLIARKGTEGLIVEVKTSTAKSSIERFQALAAEVRRHSGWRFLLVTLDDLSVANSTGDLPTWEALSEKLDRVNELIKSGAHEPATLYVWAVFEGAMRKVAVSSATPIERLPAIKVLNHLFSLGLMSVAEFDLCKSFLAVRNQITHGFGATHDFSTLEPFAAFVKKCLHDWPSTSESGQ